MSARTTKSKQQKARLHCLVCILFYFLSLFSDNKADTVTAKLKSFAEVTIQLRYCLQTTGDMRVSRYHVLCECHCNNNNSKPLILLNYQNLHKYRWLRLLLALSKLKCENGIEDVLLRPSVALRLSSSCMANF